jgi:hypothetical protein
MPVHITIKFDPRQQPDDVVKELASLLDPQVFEVELKPVWWPWAGTDPYHISLIVAASSEIAKGFFDGAGKELLDWVRLHVLAAWKKPKLAGEPAPFEMEVRCADLQIVVRAKGPVAVEKVVNSMADAAVRIIEARHGKAKAMRFDQDQDVWEEIEPKVTPGVLLRDEESREQTH